MEEKIKIENVPNVDPQRGYSSFGVENSAGLLAEKEGKDPDAKVIRLRNYFCGRTLMLCL